MLLVFSSSAYIHTQIPIVRTISTFSTSTSTLIKEPSIFNVSLETGANNLTMNSLYRKSMDNRIPKACSCSNMAVADLAFSTRTLSVISSFKLRGSREVSVEFVLSAQLNQVERTVYR